MRIALPLALLATPLLTLASLGGCHSDFASTVQLPEDCDRQWFFEDQDGDGWGRPGGNAQLACAADDSPELNLTARNNLDCDDGPDGGTADELEAAANVTGRIASICPDELMSGGAEVHAFQASGAEFAAVLPDTAITWADGAASACGATGWGGGLATFDNLTELTEVTDVLDDFAGADGYAAWVGLVPDDARTGWRWEGADAGTGLQVTEVGLCDPSNAPSPGGVLQDPGLRLALVKPPGDDWCFGFPSDANPADLGEEEFAYEARRAHFICEREPPRAADYTVDRDPGASDEG